MSIKVLFIDVDWNSRYNGSMQIFEDTYFFILGNHPDLSAAEILAVLDREQLAYKLLELNPQVLICQVSNFDTQLYHKLGGSYKFGKIKTTSPKISFEIAEKLFNPQADQGKFRFGFSFYNFSNKEIKQLQSDFKRQGIDYKKQLRQQGISARYVESRESELSSVIVDKEKLLQHGADIAVIKTESQIYYGVTTQVQDFDAFSRRDFGKPAANARSGMLPPKLARMMINLSATPVDKPLLDPFCGSGNLLMEAAALGYTQIYGRDNQPRAIEESKQNTKWYLQQKNIQPQIDIQQLDVSELTNQFQPGEIQSIVTEPYLGPPLSGDETKQEIDLIRQELMQLYIQAISQFGELLPSGGKLVMVLPLFVIDKQQRLGMDVQTYIQQADFERIDYLAAYRQETGFLNPAFESYLYFRSGQKVWRQINLWVKK